ncbi:hypothetical protein FACS1894214_5180 [Planctomycetales bacterium]|nr:hypothetical protein FACS1894214_5180 [Planctomycetales bacterium]
MIELSARFTLTLPDDLDAKVEEVAEQKGMTKTGLINLIMSDYIGTYENPGFITEFRKRIEELENAVFNNTQKKI